MIDGLVIDEEFLSAFTDEAQEQLEKMNRGFLALENNADDLETVNEVFRAAHTLKGSAGMMGFSDMARLTHEMEDFLELVRTGESRLTSSRLDVMFESLDILQKLMSGILAGQGENVDLQEIVKKLTRLSQLDAGLEKSKQLLPDGRNFTWTVEDDQTARQAMEEGKRALRINVEMDPDLPMVSAYGFLILNELRPLGQIIRSVPTEEEMEGDTEAWVTVFYVTETGDDEIRTVVEGLGMIRSLTIQSATPSEEKSLDEISEALTEVSLSQSVDAGKTDVGKVTATVPGQVSLRVEASRVDSLINLAGEISMSLTQFQELGQELRKTYGLTTQIRRHVETTQLLGQICRDLQEGAMSLRMVPISKVFQRFPRLVRDVARQTGKEIKLVLEGEETELDKTMVDEIHEPLVHLVRNAIDHGIELPAEREAAGKPREGTVILRARQAGSHIVIEVIDDGKGMNPDRLRQRALEKGVIREAEAAQMDRTACLDLIFRPGFSTVTEVSDLSGRGVGMDAVKRSIERLKGHVALDTNEGQGSTAFLHLPLTLAIIPALLVYVGEDCYAIPLAVTVELLRVNVADVNYVDQYPVINLRNQVVPVVDLRQKFATQDNDIFWAPDERLFIAIVSYRDRLAGLVVDRFIGEQSLVIKGLDEKYSRVPGVAGAAILGNGNVALILDVGELLDTSRPAKLSASQTQTVTA